MPGDASPSSCPLPWPPDTATGLADRDHLPPVRQLLRGLVRPSPRLARQVDRRRARILASAMLTVGSLGLLAVVFGPLILAGSVLATASARHGALASVIALVAYGLARTTHWRPAAVLGVAAVLYGTWANLLLAEGEPQATATAFFLVIALVLSGALLDRATTIAIGLINVAAIATVPGLFPSDPLVGRWIGAIFLGLVTTLVVVLATIWRGDLAEIETSQRQLAEREARLQAMFDTLPLYTALVDRNGRIEFINRYLPGLEPDDVLGTDFSQWFDPAARPLLRQAIARAAAGDASETAEAEGAGPHGSRALWWLRAAPIATPHGNGRVLIVAQDITELRAAEAERLDNTARDAELQQLRRLAEFKTQFINMAAHELSTPMTPVILTSRMVRAKLHEPEKAAKQLDILDRNVTRLRTLLDDLLESARMQSHRMTIRPQAIDLREAGHEAVQTYQATADNRHIRLHVDVPQQAVPAYADPNRVQQIVGNLVDNAIKYASAGDQVHVRVRDTDGHGVLEVHDTGRGMRPEQIDRLFQPFERVHERGHADPPGSGLGLYLSKGLIEQQGGSIECESPGPGKGTTFRIRLPKQAPDHAI